MTREEIDTLWAKAMHESIKDGEQFTRYHFAHLVAAAALEQPKQEPVAWHPPRREWRGLTDEERQQVYDEALAVEGVDYIPYGFARAIENALKEKNK